MPEQAIFKLRDAALSNELDYGLVMECLKNYRSPRGKLSRLLKTGDLIRVKKGLYVFSKQYQRGPLSMELIANLIYGPSYVSLEWALAYYGMIPESVEEVTSVTLGRKKLYDTPIRRFRYERIHSKLYPIGLTLLEGATAQSALIATKEKALADELIIRRGKISSLLEIERIIFDDLRIEPSDLQTIDKSIIKQLLHAYPHSAIVYLNKLLARRYP